MYFSHCQNAETLLSQNTNIRIKKLIVYSMQLHNKESYIKDPGKNTDSGPSLKLASTRVSFGLAIYFPLQTSAVQQCIV